MKRNYLHFTQVKRDNIQNEETFARIFNSTVKQGEIALRAGTIYCSPSKLARTLSHFARLPSTE